MKKILTAFLIFTYIIIVFFQSTMTSFAMHEESMGSMYHMEVMKSDCCNSGGDNCNHDCCYEAVVNDNKLVIFQNNYNFENLKKILSYYILDYSYSSQFDISFIKNNSPPDSSEDLSLQSYKNLVKIIKSNI